MLIEKKIKQFGIEENFLICDNCGEGIGLNTKDKIAVENFKEFHKNCQKPKHLFKL